MSRRKSSPPPTRAPQDGEAAAEWVAVGRLTAWEKNPRKVDDVQIRRVMDSIQKFGFAAPILARRENGEVIAGHTRVNAALRLGLERVPVRWMDLSPADAHLLAIADNKLTELGQWDEADLADLLGELRAQGDAQALVAGFDDVQIDALLAKAAGQTTDPWAEYAGMPAYASEDQTAFRSIHVHFKNAEDVAAFARALGVMLPDKAPSIWYPPQAPADFTTRAYVANDDAAAVSDLHPEQGTG